MAGSLSFDPAAEYYDRTRVTDAASLAPAIDLLDVVLPGRCAPRDRRGDGRARVADGRSRATGGRCRSLRCDARQTPRQGSRPTIPVVAGDATRLPFGSGSFGGAYCRWVLHLIADWHVAVHELCRRGRPRRCGGRRARRILGGVALGLAPFRPGARGRGRAARARRPGRICGPRRGVRRRRLPPARDRDHPGERRQLAWSGSSKRRSPGPTPGRGACPRATCVAPSRWSGRGRSSSTARTSAGRLQRMRRTAGGSTTSAADRYPVRTPGAFRAMSAGGSSCRSPRSTRSG